ncbi:MAG TPA: methionyl-tRNA formyltransferase [Feifaniaceae bacterium]|nr:methionyl-tRNA formyltransferase [Feifaniaceae bacterium]
MDSTIKTVFIGSVLLSKAALEALLDLGVSIDLVCALSEEASGTVSDYFPLHELAARRGIPCVTFRKIAEIQDRVAAAAPDFLFAIGISQIIPSGLLSAVRRRAIGFHPTALPRYRGRAPIPWMILLGERTPSISLFQMDEGMDSGDILHQEPYIIEDTDYASDVYRKVCIALAEGIKRSVPALYSGSAVFRKQEEEAATYLLVRRPEDGRIDWRQDGKRIHTLIRAAAPPYPGAFAYYKGEKIVITRAELLKNDTFIGQDGQIAKVQGDVAYVLAGGGYLMALTEYGPRPRWAVGAKLD